MFASSSDVSCKKKDFSWEKRKKNPFWKGMEEVDWEKRAEIGIFVLAIITMVFLGLYHSFFHIRSIEITGLQRITEMEIRDTALGIINYNRLLIFPGESYFIVNLDEVRDILKDKFPIDSIIVSKIFPDTIQINIEEKISTIIYDNGKYYSYIGTDGNVVETLRKVGDDEWQEKTQITTSTNETGEIQTHTEILERNHKPVIRNIITEMGDYPIVYDKRDKNAELNTQVLDSKTVFGIIDWFNLINKRTDIPFGYIIIEGELGDGTIMTSGGWKIQVKLYDEVEKQFEELQYVLKEKINRNNLNYIDLRYLGKVYWQ